MNAETIKYSLRKLSHKKGRSFLTVFSILIGIATIFLFISFGLGLYKYTDSFTTGSSADKVLILAKGAGAPGMNDEIKITDDDLKAVKKTSGVYDATGLYSTAVEVKKGRERKYTSLTSYNPKVPYTLDIAQVSAKKGRVLRTGDSGVVLGHSYLVKGEIFKNVLDLNDLIEINGKKLKIIGFLEAVGNPQEDGQIYMTNDLFLDLFPETDSYTQLVAKVDLKEIDKVVENIEKNLRKERDLKKGKEDFYVQSFEDMIESFSGALDVIVGFIILIALISILVSAVNTANTMITSVLERYKEIGLLKAIGARNSEILGIFLFESAFLGLVSGTLGVLLGWGFAILASNILTSLGYGFLQPFYPLWLFLGLIAFAILTGIISGMFPAIKAAKTNTVDALRYE